jgi:hypothetical protein
LDRSKPSFKISTDPGLEALFEAGVIVTDGETGQVRVVAALQSDRNLGAFGNVLGQKMA